MSLDGFVLSNVVNELSTCLVGGRIDKVTQPEKDELILYIRNNRVNYRLLLTTSAKMPRIHITEIQKKNPLTPPNFCMFLRKHIANGKIIGVSQPNFERIVEIGIEHRNELGDLCNKTLLIEIMGRHSNILLCDDTRKILDSIKHVNAMMSSVREVLPGKMYTYPPAGDKIDPRTVDSFSSFTTVLQKPITLHKALYQSFNGLSPLIAEEICYRAGINSSTNIEACSNEDMEALYKAFCSILSIVSSKNYQPTVAADENGDYAAFSSIDLSTYKDYDKIAYHSISALLDAYFKNISNQSRISQKSADIKRIIQNNIDRCAKKLALQVRQLEDTKDRDKFKIKGELINANLYAIQEGDKKVEVFNYYTNENTTIKLDPTLTPQKNAQKFYDKYNKKKRTFIALTDQVEETKKELEHLETIKYALEFAQSEEDIVQIRSELMDYGYLKFKKSKGKKMLNKSKPLHYISTDGFHIYVGKNNLQNDELSLKFANGSDWWFHTKEIPGSHVIVKTEGKELTDITYEEAAALAAFYSKGKDNTKVTVDYTQKKHLKKPNGSVPGYLIYHTNYSMVVEPTEGALKKIDE